MQHRREQLTRLAFLLGAISVVVATTGLYGLAYLAFACAFGFAAQFLFNLRSVAAKVTALVLFPELLTKLLMPRSTKQTLANQKAAEAAAAGDGETARAAPHE